MSKSQEVITTPLFDALRPRYKEFLRKYVERFDRYEAARFAGYVDATADEQGKTILEKPEVQAALDELIEVGRKFADRSQQAIIARLQAQAMVSVTDLADWDTDKDDYVIRPPKDVEERYRCCTGFVKYSREKHVIFDTKAQENAIKLLSELLQWHKVTHNAATIHFDFGGLKRTEYVKKKSDEDRPAPAKGEDQE